MAPFSLPAPLLPALAAVFLLTSESGLLEGSSSSAALQSRSTAGVFMLTGEGGYTMNLTAAAAACLLLNVTMATRAQVERALQHGLETCKFGWIHEKFAVVPRLKSSENCGKGKTGVVPWFASADQKFGVFCFNASGLEETSHPPTASSSPTPTQTVTPAAALLNSTSTPPPSGAAPAQTSSPTPAFTVPIKATRTDGVSSASPSPKPTSTHIPTSPSHLLTSEPAAVSFNVSAAAGDSHVTAVPSEAPLPPSASSAVTSVGVIPAAAIVPAVVLLLLTAAGAAWYHKLTQGRQKDDAGTEMWRHGSSDMDLHSQHEGEEEESMYSSEIRLCVNPDQVAL